MTAGRLETDTWTGREQRGAAWRGGGRGPGGAEWGGGGRGPAGKRPRGNRTVSATAYQALTVYQTICITCVISHSYNSTRQIFLTTFYS